MNIAEFIVRARCSWSQETAFDPKNWSADNPSAGQCAVTAEAFRRLFGGDIVRGMAGEASHYWNRLCGAHIDVTREQFSDEQPLAITGYFESVPRSSDFDRRLELFWRYLGDQEPTALAAAARQGGDVKQAPGEAPQSGGRKPVTPEPYEPWDHPSSPSHIPLMNKDSSRG